MSHSENLLVHWLDKAVSGAQKNKVAVVTTVGIVALTVVCFVGYRWYDEQIQNNAHAAFTELLKLSNAPVQKEGDQSNERSFSSSKEKWASVAQKAREYMNEHSGSGLAPLFHVMLGEAALNLGEKKDALEYISRGIGSMKGSVLKDAWQVKAACIALDSGDEKMVKEGERLLITRAEDKQSAAHQYALYQLGMHYWGQRNFSEAKNYWQQLLVQYAQQDSNVESELFIDRVKSKLALITAEE
jgi:hypothetical protein